MEEPTILVSSGDGIGRITLNRPASLNALDKETGERLLESLGALREDASVRAIVLTGAGRAFSSGGDVKEMARSGSELSESFFEELLCTLNRSIQALAEMPKPVLAAVNGVAAGLGFSLALACDIRVAARGAEFTQAFLKLGLVPDGGGTFFLPRIVGWARATELVLSARTVSSEEALRLGIVHEVVDDSVFESSVEAWAHRLAELPTAAVGRVKQLLTHSFTADLKSQLRFEREMQMASGRTADFREGVAAFAERRTPRFTGS